MPARIELRREDALAWVTISNPDRLNALTLEAWRSLGETFRALDADESVRCIVVRGAGTRAFAAGADISEFAKTRSTGEQARAYGEVVTATLQAMRACQHPTLAMVYGPCTGGGLEIASACDIVMSSASARFGIPIQRLGHVLFYAELKILFGLVGRQTCMEMLVAGRLFDADTAMARGLVARVVADEELETETRKVASTIVAGAPLSARLHKRMLSRLADSDPLSEEEIAECWKLCDSADYRRGIEAFLAKEKPKFEGD
ncbi:MAG: enoyl-CoA hydratase-related protein [Acidobacteriota bacterium]